MKHYVFALSAAISALCAPPSFAHFLLNYTQDAVIERTGDLPVALIFWHPFDNGHVMEMAAPQAFYAIHHGEKMDLAPSLEPFTFQGAQNTAQAFLGRIPIRRSGDYVIVTEPAPYYEASEDKYIQQFTKAVINRNGLPSDWDVQLDLPAEIVPLNRPYTVLTGSTFTGRVLASGAPVAGAEIEIEYMAAEPDLTTNSAPPSQVSPPKGGILVAVSDQNGYFTFGVPKAGYWGFAALGVGKKTSHNGKELSQDAVFWIKAYDLE